MFSNWTFGQRIVAGFAAVIILLAAVCVIATFTLQTVVATKDRVITVDAPFQLETERMATTRQKLAVSLRNFLLKGDEEDLKTLNDLRVDMRAKLNDLKKDTQTENGAQLVADIEAALAAHTSATDGIIALRRAGTDLAQVMRADETQVSAKRDALDAAIAAFSERRQVSLDASREASTNVAYTAILEIIVVGLAALALAIFIAFYLSRTLNRQIGAAVGHVQSSSTELQAAANQQATGVKEQVTSMNEINTTISELLATSRQIAESAQRVAQISEQTTTAARSGDGTVDRANDSIGGIRLQVDQVVSHMLELGKKSQQIGSVLDIVTELAEQTNILSINATIEAAGAGETGKRFSVVADEIRKLADRVAASAKEIRTLIDDVRSSVNTTVMATETGSKAVDAGSRQFADVATVFRDIARMVTTTTEAAREIELSTKQQATAVEQVNIAIANVAQATKETEASAGQTIQTASELASTSRDLLRLVRRQTAA